MYSVVLMTALAAGGAGSQELCFGRGHGCNGGCYGYHSCYSSCSGCYGGGWGGCHGCHGGCYGGGWGGCHGGCYGGYGGYGMYSGFNAYQCHGCFGCSGWMGCYGCTGCFAPVVPPPVVPPPPKNGKEVPPPPPPGQEEVSDRATLTVELPEDARLYVDNVLMKSTSAKRVFVTPPLQPGKTYFYVLKAEIERDGQPVAVTGQVVLQPGQQIQASLTEPAATGSFVVKVNNKQ